MKTPSIANFLAVTAKKIYRAAGRTIYAYSRRRPYSLGYNSYKRHLLNTTINNTLLLGRFSDPHHKFSGYGFSMDSRVVEIPWIFSRLSHLKGPLLDAGSSLNHEYLLTAPALSNKEITIATLAPETQCFWHMGISYIFCDIRNLNFKDDCFNIITCISTIEHVGMDNKMYLPEHRSHSERNTNAFVQAINELKRVLAVNGVLYLSFPFGKYEDHGWLQQFDSEHTDILINTFKPAKHTEAVFKYDSDGWKISSRIECSQCQYFDIHTTKHFNRESLLDFPPNHPAGERAVICLELFK